MCNTLNYKSEIKCQNNLNCLTILYKLKWVPHSNAHKCPHTLTHWGRATHICISKLTIIASDNGLSPGRHQAIIWNNDGILSIWLFGTKFSEILIKFLTFSFKQLHLKMSSAKWQPLCLGLNVLNSQLPPRCQIHCHFVIDFLVF